MSGNIKQAAGLGLEERRALLAELLRQESNKASRFPLSFAQQRLWFLDQLEGESSSYNVATTLRIRGNLNVPCLELALREIMTRHEILRTSFVEADGEPWQAISPLVASPLTLIDLRGWPSKTRETELLRLASEEVRRPFNLAKGPLLRICLIQTSDVEHVLLLTMHHIVTDGWSMGVFNREMGQLYEAFVAGQPSPLAELPIQYRDYAFWQREYLQGEVIKNKLAYWKDQLTGAPELLELPTDRPRPLMQTFIGKAKPFVIPPALTQELQQLSRREGVTLFMTLLAAFQVLLSRYSGIQDVVVGTPIAGRTRQEVEGLIGLFLNALALRTKISEEISFRELLAQVRETCLGAFAHQDVPFENLVQELKLERDLSRTPLFQVVFILQNTPPTRLEIKGLSLSPFEVESGSAKFDLTLEMVEHAGELIGWFRYNTDLFESATIERIISHFERLLRNIIVDPSRNISHLDLLDDVERKQLLVEWNQTARSYCHDADGILGPLENLVSQKPEATAYTCEDRKLNYSELNRRANQLAHYLRGLGVQPEVRVGVCMERGLDHAVTLLAIFKAGGVYLFLDPTYPPKRLSSMLKDAGAELVVSHKKHASILSVIGARVVCMDQDEQIIAGQSDSSLPISTVPENLAFLIYTSGSTGQPKAVCVEHRHLLNRLDWMWESYPFGENEIACHKTALNYVDSLWELLGPVCRGVPTVIIPDHVLNDPEALVQALAVNRVTRIWVVPSQLSLLLSTCSDLHNRLPALDFWVTTGEALGRDLLERFRQEMPNKTLYNLYGTSEVWDVTWCEVSKETEEDHSRRVPIGRPIANMRVYVVDRNLHPVPLGVWGDLCVGGAQVARGYLDQPELTAERFLPDPFSSEPGARLYRTGDLTRYAPDGNVEYLGRGDHQVKIRGHRVELGEIETVLNEHEAVRVSAVVSSQDSFGETNLAAYIVPGQQPPTSEDLRRFVRERLPVHMLPTSFVAMKSLPLTPSGKLDRRALPAQDTLQSSDREYIAPRDLIELRLTRIWESVLGVRPISITDNFFDLGGHSLLAVRLMSRIRAIWNHELPLTTLFNGATVEQFAARLRQETSENLQTPLVEVQAQGSKAPFFWVHPIGGNVLCYIELARALGSDQPVYGLQAEGLYKTPPTFVTIEEMATHYLELVRTVQAQGPYLLGGWSMGGFVAFEMAQQLQALGDQVSLMVLLDVDPLWTEQGLVAEEDPALWQSFALDMGLVLDDLSPIAGGNALGLNGDALVNDIMERAKRAGIVPDDLDLPRVHQLFDVYRNNLQAMRTYRLRSYPGHMTLIKAGDRYKENQDQLTEGDWRRFAGGGLDTYTVPGNHYSMIRSPNVQVMAALLNSLVIRQQRIEPDG